MKEVAGMALRKNVPLNESKININYVQFKLDNIYYYSTNSIILGQCKERQKVVIST